MDVSVVVVNWHAGRPLEVCLRKVYEELTTVDGECIVVDNGSEKGEIEGLRRSYSKLLSIVNRSNVGFARAANQGMRKGKGRYLLLLNPDAFLTKGSLSHLISYLDAHPDVGVVGPRITNSDGTLQGSARGFPGLLTAFFGRSSLFTKHFPRNPFSRHNVPALSSGQTEPQSVDWLSGACMVIRRKTREDVGDFDERFFMYWEDADLCWRMRNGGWRVVYDPRVSIVHLVGASSRHARVRAIVDFHKSSYRVYRKHVTRSSLHPLNVVAAAGLSLRAAGLILLAGLSRRSRSDADDQGWDGESIEAEAANASPLDREDRGVDDVGVGAGPSTLARTRVLRVIARLNIGGPALHASLLTERLDPNRYDSHLVAGTEEAGEGNYLRLYGRAESQLTVVPEFGREIRIWRDVIALFHLTRLMLRIRPQVVHTHTAKAGTLGRVAARMTGVPLIVHTYHGHVFHGYFSAARTRLFLAIERTLARSSDRLLTVSETVRSELLDLGIGTRDQLMVMPLGLDLDRYVNCEEVRGQFRRELGLDQDVLLVGIVARLVPIKAHELFLEAAAIVAGRFPQIRFIVVGDGERREDLESLVRQLGCEGQVLFLGWRQDLDRIYADLDLAVLTSRNEGSPVSLIEAMAAGLAVVSTRVGGVPDLVQDGMSGMLVESEDIGGLAEAIVSLLGDPQRRKALGEVGRRRVYPAYSADRLLGDMDHLYSELLSQRGL